MIRLDLVINTFHGAKVLKKMLDMLVHTCKLDIVIWYGNKALKTLNDRWQSVGDLKIRNSFKVICKLIEG